MVRLISSGERCARSGARGTPTPRQQPRSGFANCVTHSRRKLDCKTEAHKTNYPTSLSLAVTAKLRTKSKRKVCPPSLNFGLLNHSTWPHSTPKCVCVTIVRRVLHDLTPASPFAWESKESGTMSRPARIPTDARSASKKKKHSRLLARFRGTGFTAGVIRCNIHRCPPAGRFYRARFKKSIRSGFGGTCFTCAGFRAASNTTATGVGPAGGLLGDVTWACSEWAVR